MPEMKKQYIAIDLKSFYASVECMERNLDPLKTHLVVADPTRTDKTICLAVSPSLKAYGLPGRCRLFEAKEAVKKINYQRIKKAPNHKFIAKSFNDDQLKRNPSLELDFVIAQPQMAKYIEKSTEIYKIYLKYIDSEDIHVYSIDEVFIDVTKYLKTYKKTASQIASMLIKEVYDKTGITATAGVGDNLYLCKVAMDILAKHAKENEDGVRIASLDEMTYRKLLWDHLPLTDFWRVGRGLTKRLYNLGLFTMGDIARQSLINEDVLYEEFGINAELLIDHAWGYEPTTMDKIKSYEPENNSLSIGQVLPGPYEYSKALIIIKEMAESLSLDMVAKGLLTDQIAISIGYDVKDLTQDNIVIDKDWYGRDVPKGNHSSINIGQFTNSTSLIEAASVALFDKLVNKKLHVRRMYIVATRVIKINEIKKFERDYEQLNLFVDYDELEKKKEVVKAKLEEENKLQQTINTIKKKYGKNKVLKGRDFEEGGTTRERNEQIGGHKA